MVSHKKTKPKTNTAKAIAAYSMRVYICQSPNELVFEYSLAKLHDSFKYKNHDKCIFTYCSKVRIFIVAQSGQYFLSVCILSKVKRWYVTKWFDV